MTDERIEVTLGDITYNVVAQPHVRLKRQIAKLFESLGEAQLTSGGGLFGVIADKMYEACAIFIPNLMPRSAWEAEESTITFPQQKAAIQAGLRVNGLEDLKALGKLVSPDLIRSLVTASLADAMSQTRSLPTSRSANGASTSTSSGVTTPTSPMVTDAWPEGSGSRSPDSEPSSPAATSAG